MSNRFTNDTYRDDREPDDDLPRPSDRDAVDTFPPLPWWLERRLLQPDEEVTWVRGPKWNPGWERFATHPLAILIALVLAIVCLFIGRSTVESWARLPIPFGVGALLIVVLGILFVGFCSGHFTRLVVTTSRVVIMQGYEVYRSWGLDRLPRSLLRFDTRRGMEGKQTIDLDALKSKFGAAASDKFVEAKTILDFGKQIEQIKAKERDTLS